MSKALETLKNRQQFVHLNKRGKKWTSRSVIIQIAENQNDTARIGFTVTKRVSKLAVTRNRIKRRLRAAAKGALISTPGFDYVLIGGPATRDVPYKTLCNDIVWCVKRLQA